MVLRATRIGSTRGARLPRSTIINLPTLFNRLYCRLVIYFLATSKMNNTNSLSVSSSNFIQNIEVKLQLELLSPKDNALRSFLSP